MDLIGGEALTTQQLVMLVILVTAAEAAVLLGLYRWRGGPLGPLDILTMLAPGACLLGALHSAVSDADQSVLAVWLGTALVAHLVDLFRRSRHGK